MMHGAYHIKLLLRAFICKPTVSDCNVPKYCDLLLTNTFGQQGEGKAYIYSKIPVPVYKFLPVTSRRCRVKCT